MAKEFNAWQVKRILTRSSLTLSFARAELSIFFGTSVT